MVDNAPNQGGQNGCCALEDRHWGRAGSNVGNGSIKDGRSFAAVIRRLAGVIRQEVPFDRQSVFRYDHAKSS